MKIYGYCDKYEYFEPNVKGTAVGLGNFDGVHKGHAALLETLTAEAEKRNLPSLVYMFERHPSNVLCQQNPVKLIISNKRKCEIMEEKGIDAVYFDDFTKVYAEMTPDEFAENIIAKKLNAKLLVVGENFSFGKNAAGNCDTLSDLGRRYGFDVIVIPTITIGGEVVSSSNLRAFIKDGRFDKYEKFTGMRYMIPGEVSHGREVGRLLGFPTANISPSEKYVRPMSGVYATETVVGGKRFCGITNVGSNPTFGLNHVVVETHILDFDDNIYEKPIEVEFLYKMRDEIKFSGPEELKKQIAEDLAKRKHKK